MVAIEAVEVAAETGEVVVAASVEEEAAPKTVVRPVVPVVEEAVTGVPAIPGKHLPLELVQKMVSEIGTVPGISRVLYDLTPKPPGTTEWE